MNRVHDVGLQAERTRLSWNRTALALAVIGALELHIPRAEVSVLQRIPGICTLLLALVVWVFGGRRYVAINRALTAGRSVLTARGPLGLAVVVLLPATFALWSILVS